MVVDELARRHGGTFKGKFSGHVADVRVEGHRLALLKPDTYMNDSGRSVQPAAAFYKAPLETRARRARRGRPRLRSPAGTARRRSRRPQRPALDRRPARQSRLPAAARRRRAPGSRRSARRGRLRARAVRAGRGRRGADRAGAPTRSSRSSRSASTRRSAGSTELLRPITRSAAGRQWRRMTAVGATPEPSMRLSTARCREP